MFEVSVERFQELRLQVALLLREMMDVSRSPMYKLQDLQQALKSG